MAALSYGGPSPSYRSPTVAHTTHKLLR